MYYYKSTIQYAGTNYIGFQWQTEKPTVQSEINRALSQLSPGKITTMAASRTDTGVHAMEQIVKITSSEPFDLKTFRNDFNQALPDDILCTQIDDCSGEFKPAHDAVSKEYRYFFTNKTQVESHERQFIANISNPLNLELIRSCLEALVGTHDFCNFYSYGSDIKSTVRTIHFCELSLVNPASLFSQSELFQIPASMTECFELRISGDGFLKQMIRHIVAALWRVGSGKLSVEDFISLLDSPMKEQQPWKVAPANGLFLYRVNYS